MCAAVCINRRFVTKYDWIRCGKLSRPTEGTAVVGGHYLDRGRDRASDLAPAEPWPDYKSIQIKMNT
jgi:hypothetical protein